MLKLVRVTGGILGGVRWAFMPLGLFALVAVGIHAGADALDDRILVALDWADGQVDQLLAFLIHGVSANLLGFSKAAVESQIFTACDFVGLKERESLAKALALVLELFADLVLAFPALGYSEERAPTALPHAVAVPKRVKAAGLGRSLELLVNTFKDPTVLRVVLPLATLLVAVAGACTIAREVETTAFGAIRAVVTLPGIASSLSRLTGIVVLGAVFVSLGGRALGRSLEHAFKVGEADPRARPVARRLRGWLPSTVIIPLSVAAALHGAPLLSFFR